MTHPMYPQQSFIPRSSRSFCYRVAARVIAIGMLVPAIALWSGCGAADPAHGDGTPNGLQEPLEGAGTAPQPPVARVAKAAEQENVYEGSVVCLDGSQSEDPNNDPLTFDWRQTAGAPIDMAADPANPARICFRAPNVDADTRLVFKLTVSDGTLASDTSVNVDVQPLPEGAFQVLSVEAGVSLPGVISGEYHEDFNAVAVEHQPPGWSGDAASTPGTGFRVAQMDGESVLSVTPGVSAMSAQFHGTGSDTWGNYVFTGRLRRATSKGGVGVLFLIDDAGPGRRYALRQHASAFEGASLRLEADGTALTGDVETQVSALPGEWFRFRIEVETGGSRTSIRARTWRDGTHEPTTWQADAYDDSPARIQQGAIGAWAEGSSQESWDDFLVRTLSGIDTDPVHWYDSRNGNSLVEDPLLFDLYPLDGQTYFGTQSSLAYIHSHYVGPGSNTWTDYLFGGRFYFDADSAGTGVTFYSAFPNRLAYYRLSREKFNLGPTLRISALGTSISRGNSSTGVVPQRNTWYEFKVQVTNEGAETAIRAKVWAVGTAEPDGWQAECFDGTSKRLTSGTIGVWSAFDGYKYWRDLYIAPVGAPDACTADSDGDGESDCTDDCPDDPNKIEAGICGCGIRDDDTDFDGKADCVDGCPRDATKLTPGACGCGLPDLDADGDGTPDCIDLPVIGPYEEHFERFACNQDPTDWLDTAANFSLSQDESLFKVLCSLKAKFLGTDSTAANICSHMVGSDSASWTAYRLSGRMFFTAADSGIGITVFSEFPAGNRHYRLERNTTDRTFHLAAQLTGGVTLSGNTSTGVPTDPNNWYRFVIEAADAGNRTTLKAKVWLEGQAEPADWQADAYDGSVNRLRQGSFGVWASGSGTKYWDDFQTSQPSSSGGSNPCAADRDGDGTPDCTDQCADDPNKISPGACGCGASDADADHNGTADCLDPPPPSGGTMNVASRTSGVAPLAVFFDVVSSGSGVYQPAGADYAAVRYLWDFGDPSSGAWATDGKPKNKALGHVAAHVYDQHGTYTVTLQATAPDGKLYVYSQTITVQAFSGTTYYVAADGNDLNSGQSQSAPLRTFEKAMSLAKTNTRIRFRRGDTWTTAYGGSISQPGPGIVDSYGSGALPKIVVSNNFTAAFKVQARDWRLMDLYISGPADPAAQGAAVDAGVDNTTQVLVQRVTAQGFYVAFTNGWYRPPVISDQNFFVDCETFGSSNKATFLGSERLAIMGCNMHDTQTHILRIWHAIRCVVEHNRLVDPQTASGAVIKLHNAVEIPNNPDGRWIIISDNYIRGHTWDVTIGTQNATSYEVVRDVLVERNFVKAAAPTQIAFRFSAQNVIARNNIGDLTGATYTCKLFSVTRWGVEPPPTGNRLFNNAAFRNDGGDGLLTEAVLSDTLTYNNLAWSSAGKVTIGPTNGNSQNNLTANPQWMNAVSGDFRLKAGSPAIDAGRTAPVFDDYAGTLRPIDGDARNGAAIDVGPYEYSP